MNQPNQPQVPSGYADSFNVNAGVADIEILFGLRGTPMFRMILSHATAKELEHQLREALQQFERASGQKVTRLNDLIETMNTNTPQGGPQRGSKIIM